MPLENLPGPVIFLTGMLIMFLVVPAQKIKELLLIGLAGGIGVGIVLVYVMQNIYGFWVYSLSSDLIHIAALPFFLIAGWFPVIILFAYLLGRCTNRAISLLIILVFPAGATVLHFFMLKGGMLFYHNWSLGVTFLQSLGIHLLIALFLYATGRLAPS